jgi:hypothetical protein
MGTVTVDRRESTQGRERRATAGRAPSRPIVVQRQTPWWSILVAAAMAASIVLVVERVAPVPPSADLPESATPMAAPDFVTSARVAAGDVAVELTDGAAIVTVDDTSFALTTARIGEVVPGDPAIEQHSSRVVNTWPGVQEWYRDRDGVIEHGYTIDEPVSGDELVVEVEVAGAQPLPVDERGIVLLLEDDSLVSYRDLIAFDADGRDLSATMSVVDSTIVLTVDADGATYPVTVDPIITEDQVLRSATGGDEFGTSVAVDGNRMAVGVPGALPRGEVRMFTRALPGALWTADGTIVNPFASYSEFGRSVSLLGDQVAVGAPSFINGPSADQGRVLVYEKTGASWTTVDDFGPPDAAGSYGFGFSVDFIDTDRLVIGAPGFVEGAGDQALGQVFEYDSGVVAQIPVGATTGIGDDMGYSVAGDVRPGSGVRIAVGAPGDDTDNGLFRLLDDTGSGWTIRTGFSGGIGSRLGSAVDVSGDRAAFDSTNNVSVTSTSNGGVDWSIDLTTSVARGSYGGSFNDHFDLEGGTLAVGAPISNKVEIFRYDGFSWGGSVLSVGQDTLQPGGAAGDDRAGYSVALDGSTLAVGAPGDDGVGDITTDSGAVFATEVPVIATFTFPDDTYGAWSDPANWDIGVVPGPDDRAIIPDNTYAEVDDTRVVDRVVVDGFLRMSGRLSVSGASEVTPNGFVIVDPTGRFDLPDLLNLDGDLITTDGAQVVSVGSRQVTGAGAIDNDGEIIAEGGGLFTTGPSLTWTSGPTGVLFATDGSDIEVQGAYDARGTTAAKAGSAVILAGNLDVVATSVVEIEVSGPSTSTDNYGQIIVGGSLTRTAGVASVADGTIRVALIDHDVTPSDSYEAIVCGGSCQGDNERFAVTDTGELDVIAGFDAVRLEVVPNKIISPDPGQERFGAAVDVEGDWMIVGGQAVAGGDPGRAYLYENVGGGWEFRQTFTSTDGSTPGGTLGDQFGLDVAISDNYLVVGMPNANSLLYSRPSTSSPFTFAGETGPALGDLDIVDGWLITGPVSSTVFVWNLATGDFPIALAAPGGQSSAWGASLALGGDLAGGTGYAAVGDPGNAPTAGGSVYVYPQSTWLSAGAPVVLTSPDGSVADERFGNALDASGGFLAVGEWFNNAPNPAGGAAWVFEWEPGTTSMTPFPRLVPADNFTSDTFGSDVAIDGGTLLVGAGADQRIGFPFRDGSAYAFRYDGTSWIERQQVRAPDGGNQERFGDFVALSGRNAVAGAWLDVNDNGTDAGAVYTYDVPVVATFIDPAPGAPWNDPANWDIGEVPSIVDTAIVPAGTEPSTTSAGIGRLIVEGSLSILSGATFSVFGLTDGPSIVEEGGVITVGDDAALNLEGDVAIDGFIATSPPGIFDTSTIRFVNPAGTQDIDGPGTISNGGDVVKVGSGTTRIGSGISWINSNLSTVRVTGGAIDVQTTDFTADGELDVRLGASLSFAGDLTLVPTSDLFIQVNSDGQPGGTIDVGGALATAGALRIDNTGDAPVGDGAPYPIITCGDCLGGVNLGRFDSYQLPSLEVIPTPTSLSLDVVPNKIVSPSTPGDGSQFGRAIAIQGDLAVVGAPTGLGANQGGAYVLSRDPSTGDWSIIQTLNPSPAGFSGYKVLLDGDIMIVQSSSPPDEASYLYARTGPTTAPFVFVERVAGDHNYGSALQDGLWLVQNQDTREVDVYDVTTSGATLVTSIPIPTTEFVFAEEIGIGGDVAADEAFAVIGSPNEGKVFVFEQTGPTTWVLIQEVVSPAGEFYGFGNDVAIQGDQVFIGESDPFGIVVPAVYVYTKTPSGLVNPVRIEPSDTTPGSQFGLNVAVDGNVLAVGALAAQRNGPTSRDGATYVFQFDGDMWQETDVIRAPDGFDFDLFGSDVALDGNRLLVGATNDANEKQVDAFSGAGAIYWYEIDLVALPTSLTFDLDVQVGSESVEVATGISISQLDPAVTAAGQESTLAASPLTAVAADDPESTPLTAIDVGATPLTAIVLDSEVLSAIPLVNIDIDGGWEQIIAGSELVNEPLASVTFGQVLAAGSPSDPSSPSGRFAATPLTAIEVDGTPLTAITLGAIALGETPLTAIPLTAIDPTLDWCDIVAELVPPGTNCDDAFLGTLTVLEVTLRGVPLTAIPLAELPLTAIDPADSPLTAIPLTAIDLFQTPLTAIPATAVPLTAIGIQDAPLTAIPLTAIPASAVPLTAIPPTAINVIGSPLTAIRADATPLTAIDPTGAPLTAIQLEGAPLLSLPLTAIALMEAPLTAIPLTAIGGTSAEITDQWCELLDDAPIDDNCGTGIDPATTTLRELFVRGLPLTAIPFESIPLTAINVAGAPLTAIALEDAPLTAIPVGGTPLTAIGVTIDVGSGPVSTPLTAIPLTAIDLVGSSLADTPLTAIDPVALPLTAIDVDSLPLTAIPVAGAPLTAILVNGSPLTAIGLAPADLAGSPLTAIRLADLPLTAINCSAVNCETGTIADALEAGAIRPGLTLGDLQAGATGVRLSELIGVLPNVAPADLLAALAGLTLEDWTELDDVTLGDLPNNVLAQFALTLGDLGAALTLITYGDLASNLLDPLTGQPLPNAEAEIRAAIDALGLTLGDLPTFDDVTLGDLVDGYLGQPLSLQDIPTVLGFITVAALEDLLNTTFDLTGISLGELSEAELGQLTLGDLVPLLDALGLGELLGAIEDELTKFTLGDLLLALVDPGSLALGGVDFVDVDTLELPEGTVPPSTFEATFELGGSRTRAVAIEVRLPPSADYLAGSGRLFADTGGGPILVDQIDPIVDGDGLRLGVAADPGTAYTYEFDVLPSLRLGSTSLGAIARVVGTGLSVPALASVDVLEGSEPNDFPDTVLANEDVIYLTYISTPSDNDVYEITLQDDDELVVQLSNLTADLDLVLWGDPDDPTQDAALSGTSDAAPVIPVTDPDADGADAEPLDDFLRLDEIDADLNLVAVSNRPGKADELLSTGRLPAGTYYMQVYGSNGATNVRPAAFQLAVVEAETPPECVGPNLPTLGAPGAVPTIGSDVNTLILVNGSRLEQYYGNQARQDVAAAIVRLENHLAGDPTINPVTISVDGVPAVAAAYAAWDADSCNPNAANDVVAAINADIIDPVRDQLEHVVILGGDELVPMARLSDATVVANEYDYRHEFDGDIAGANPDGRNSLTSAQWESKILSDDPYGDADARSLGDRFLYVTDLALGRLVESPDDIVDQLDTFVQFDGLLAIDTAAVLGYDFLVDGSEAAADSLAAALPNTTDDELADGLNASGQPWDRVDATDVLDGARTNALISLNAHFDHYRALPAVGDKVPGFNDNLIAAEVAAELGPEALLRSLIFSAGCHSALAVSDVLITTTSSDWAEILGQQGALFVGNTGFGYGDTEAVAYTELLMALFAEQVTAPFDLDPGAGDASSTVGQALAWAKNEYIAGLQTLSVYDEKAVMESTFFGLPFYRVGLPTVQLPAPPVNVPVAGELEALVDAVNVENVTPAGTYYSNTDADGGELTIVAPGRPIQPKQIVDVSVVDPNNSRSLDQVAHGAIIESMTSTYIAPLDPVVAAPIFDETNSQPEPELMAGAFPTRPLTITSSNRPEGARQRLVLATGQFRSGPDVQRLDDDIDVTVFYADPAETDFTPPRIGAVESQLGGGDLQIRLTASDGPLSGNSVERVFVLVATDPGIGTVQWMGTNLTNTSGDEWAGTLPLPAGTSAVEFIVQARDSVGNVGIATNKAFNFGDLVAAPPPVAGDLEVSVAGNAGTGGWFDGPVTVTVTGSATPLQYFVDGAGPTAISSGDSFEIAVGGPHAFRVESDAAEVETGVVRIDDDGAPDIDIRRPVDGSSFVTGSGARLDVVCTDRSRDLCRRRVTRTDVPGSSPQLVSAGAALPTQPGTYELRVRATDRVGNQTIEFSTFTITALVGPPEIREITGPLTPQEITEAVTIEALFADVSGTSNDYTATVDWGDGTTTEVTVPEADEPTATRLGRISATRTYAVTDVYTVTVTVRDDAAGEDVGTFEFVVLFDPTTNGRVSGAGFYWSGPEAYADSGAWGSPAFFGYRARYKNGDDLPSGRTKLRLLGEFFFRSTAYDYLIVNDTLAIAEGVGTTGGSTEYRFRVQGVDNGWIDFFQITIWDETTGDVLYDNGVLYDDGDVVLLGGIRVRS